MDNAITTCAATQQKKSEYHVASFVAHVSPDFIEQFINDVNAEQGTEIHAVSDIGKIVFTIEATSQKQIAIVVDQLKIHVGLYSLSPIYHQFLTED
ncbi:chaperone NapD [Thalassotalea sediminis]|uniref:chaperone NapD n=1 Tax=Thalassotalea sediminis TaxID=1759089 RepID=UPI00257325BE|nr:chaperone NapD [Thalassotalea sediminis]